MGVNRSCLENMENIATKHPGKDLTPLKRAPQDEAHSYFQRATKENWVPQKHRKGTKNSLEGV